MRSRPYSADDYGRCCDLLRDSNVRYSFSEKSDAKLFEDIVASESFYEDYTLVLESGGAACGIVMFTKHRVKKFDGLLLSIFYIDDERLSDDNADLLMGDAVDDVMGLRVKFIYVMGEPSVFTRFGFTRARDCGILYPFYIGDDYSMVRCEDGLEIRGELSYAKELFG